MESHQHEIKVFFLPWLARPTPFGWLGVGVLALAKSDFPNRWLWAAIGLASGGLLLPVARPVRVVFDVGRGLVTLYRPALLWRTKKNEWPMSNIAEAKVVFRDMSRPFDGHWGRGRDGLVLMLRTGERIPIVDRLDVKVERLRDRMNALLASYDSAGRSCSPGAR